MRYNLSLGAACHRAGRKVTCLRNSHQSGLKSTRTHSFAGSPGRSPLRCVTSNTNVDWGAGDCKWRRK